MPVRDTMAKKTYRRNSLRRLILLEGDFMAILDANMVAGTWPGTRIVAENSNPDPQA